MGPLRKILVALVVISALSSASTGTFASFTASTTNSGTFQTGTIVLSSLRKTGSTISGSATGSDGTVCLSTGGADPFTNGNANTSCDVLMSSSTTYKPGDSDIIGRISVQNVGTIAAGSLKVYASPVCSTSNDAGSYHGNGNVCSTLRFSIQETDASWANVTNGCRYGTGAGSTACTSPSSLTLADFGTSHPVGTPLTLAGGLAASSTRYFQLRVSFQNGSAGAENATMGRIASTGFGWVMEQ